MPSLSERMDSSENLLDANRFPSRFKTGTGLQPALQLAPPLVGKYHYYRYRQQPAICLGLDKKRPSLLAGA